MRTCIVTEMGSIVGICPQERIKASVRRGQRPGAEP